METLSIIYLSVSTFCIVISISYCAYVVFVLVREKDLFKRVKENSLLISWFLLVPPGLLLVLVFLVENSHQIYFKEALQDGVLCKFCAFCAILTLTALNGCAITVAYLTYLFVKNGKRPAPEKAMIGNIVSWLAGLAFSFVYLFGDVFGPYRGIYCCVKQQYFTGALVGEMFMVFGFSAAFEGLFYLRSVMESRKLSQRNTHANQTSFIIMRRGLEMILIFYVSYVLVAVDSVIIFARLESSIWLSMVAAWMVKLEPFWHCFLLHRILKRIRKSRARVMPYNETGPASRNKSSSKFGSVVHWLQSIQSSCSRPSKKYNQLSVRRKVSLKDLGDKKDRSLEK